MGTTNFMRYEATRVYATETQDNDNDLAFEDAKESIYEALFAMDVKSVNGVAINVSTMDPALESNSNYPENYLGTIEVKKMYSDVEVSVLVHVYLIAGYYNGFNADYKTEVRLIGVEEDSFRSADLEANLDLANYSAKMNRGICTIQNRNVLKFVDKVLTELLPKVEEMFDYYSHVTLEVQGVMSNGEAVYSEIEKDTSVSETELMEELEELYDDEEDGVEIEETDNEVEEEDVFGDPLLGEEDISTTDLIDESEDLLI